MPNEFVQTSNGKAKSIRSCITGRIDGLERKPMRFALWLTGRCDNHHPERATASQLDRPCSRGCDEEIAQCFVTFTGRRLIMWILRFHTQSPAQRNRILDESERERRKLPQWFNFAINTIPKAEKSFSLEIDHNFHIKFLEIFPGIQFRSLET